MPSDNDDRLFRQAEKKYGAVEGRTSGLTAGNSAFPHNPTNADAKVVHCFDKEGREVCLFLEGCSTNLRPFNPPREWPHRHFLNTTIKYTGEGNGK